MTLRKTTLGSAEERRLEAEFWAMIPPDERFAEAWRLSLEIWRFKGWDPGEPRLSRSTARVVRR